MKVKPATEADIKAMIRAGLRKSDEVECRRMFGRSAATSLWDGFIYSDLCFVVHYEGEAIAAGGVLGRSALSPGGTIWLLGTDKIEAVWYAFAKESHRVINVLLDEYKILENLIDVTNKKTIRWLKWLGFQCDPVTCSPLGHPFQKFWKRR